MAFSTHNRGGRRRTLILASAALLTAASISIPAAAFADVSDNGGATRNDGDKSAALRASIVDGPAKNVILLIGDGMGDSEITVARNYEYGAAGELPGIDALPLTGQYTTYSVYRDGANKGKPDYVPDSAATGSAWSTGTKTFDNAISVDIDGNPQDTLIEIAKANGLKTGNVSTAEIQDATPAVEVAHVDARSCYGPDSATCGDDALAAGGLGSISEQLLDTRADLTLGGGSTSFGQTAKAGEWNGETLFAQAEDRGYQLIDDAAGLAGVTTADQTSPVLGLFTPGNFPTRYAATTATVGGADGAPVTCQPNPDRLGTDLSLKSLTSKAISLLDTDDNGDKGFFLQVEGASIDKQDHAANACGQIGETIDLDEAVQAALEFAKTDGNTLVIVTADHAHTSQIVDSTPPAGLSTALTTADGTVMKVAYGTAAAGGSQQHTGSQLRIAAYGPGGAQVVGLTDQTDNFFTMASALELNRDTASLSSGATASLSSTTVEPGAELTVSASGFQGDRQLAAVVASTPTDLGSRDVIDGTADYTFAAPTEPGVHTVTLTGRQSAKAVVVEFTVAAAGGPATPPTTPGGAAGDGSGASGSGTASASGVLGNTGAVVAPFLVFGGLLLAAGVVLVLQRRRRHA
ncbi:alkaline phosphatase [Herbiconiux sp. CPCC 205763]|uniref:Alkaline phosphatase n=1 Tax=Herbiconiux aconitum TaxID=2970913 RepID=A0ABT2GP14_9MICO|nr:alkaline phosphatase [Herbiconiux aconitum]MCS5717967.1 alkaline phosphatase [Herbiconiux aconitum]